MKKLGRLGLIIGVLSLAGTMACKSEPPDLAKPHRAKGNDHMNKKEWKQAIAEYEQALKIDAKQEKVWKHKGTAHLQLGEKDKAQEAFQKRLELIDQRPAPADETPEKAAQRAVDTLAEKTEIYIQLGDPDKALEMFQKRLELLEKQPAPADDTPEKAAKRTADRLAEKKDFYSAMANLYLTSGRSEQAEQIFNEVLKLNPKDEGTLSWLAEIYMQRGGAKNMAAPLVDEHLQKALGYYDQVLAINPISFNTYVNKRVVMIRYLENEKTLLRVAELEMAENARKPAKLAEAKAKAEASNARIQEFTAKLQELNQKMGEAHKAQKAAAAAPAPAPAPAK